MIFYKKVGEFMIDLEIFLKLLQNFPEQFSALIKKHFSFSYFN